MRVQYSPILVCHLDNKKVAGARDGFDIGQSSRMGFARTGIAGGVPPTSKDFTISDRS
ncbi:hypothetical protein [Cylindrospermum sp. FACHB-282]|uniref:hypothetical protein n=1 Tax=Cylindrospermum sp. FACHB-282 TaxID=2692794 RepID=UPI00168921CB|nr:hypothetical protein [Cylindrospermum sp. FACHB-282]MBD2385951.1 hypothetical protein [Cylindrospermum sp. FACHB-282]